MIDRVLRARDGREVALRALSTADAAAFAAHVRGDLERLSEHLAWPARSTTTESAVAWIAGYEQREDGRLVVAGLWQGDELLGGVLLLNHDERNANAELGCWIVAAGEGQGLVAAGCRTLIAYAASLGVQRLTWHCATTNTRSRQLAERLGFVYEGTSRSDYVLRDGRLDTDVYALVGDELARAAQRP